MERYDCLVTDGQWRKSVAAVRSLGAVGHRVTVLGDSIFTTGFWSRYTSARLLSPTPDHDAARFGAGVHRFLDREPVAPKPILFMEDASLGWGVANAAALHERGGRFLLPDANALAVAADKGRTAAFAAGLGIGVPETFQPAEPGDIADVLRRNEGRGFVVKPRAASGSSGVLYVEGGNAAHDWRAHWAAYGALIVQERIPEAGRAIGVSLLFDGAGECKASFAHERLRQYPVSGGPSTDRISIAAPEVVERSIRLLQALGWRGVAMVEWKVDPVSAEPKLLEINPRFWGSLELAIRCGVDFPVLYATAALGLPIEAVHQFVTGRRCRWLIPGEILRYLSEPEERREGVRAFLQGLPQDAEEWDAKDLPGTVACALCPALLLLTNPKYWRFLRSRR